MDISVELKGVGIHDTLQALALTKVSQRVELQCVKISKCRLTITLTHHNTLLAGKNMQKST